MKQARTAADAAERSATHVAHPSRPSGPRRRRRRWPPSSPRRSSPTRRRRRRRSARPSTPRRSTSTSVKHARPRPADTTGSHATAQRRLQGRVARRELPATIWIDGVPAYQWRCGCGPTAVGMIVGYYDGQGYDLLVPGSATTSIHGGSTQMIASQGGDRDPGHWEDYWLPNGDDVRTVSARQERTAGRRRARAQTRVADFMHASWSVDGCIARRDSYVGWGEFGFSGTCTTKYPDATIATSTVYRPRPDLGRRTRRRSTPAVRWS